MAARWGMIGARAALTAAVLLVAGRAGAEDANDLAVAVLREEIAIAGILAELEAAAVPQVTILRDVRVVDPLDRSVRDRQSVIVSLGSIYWVGDRSSEPDVGEAAIVDAGGRFAAPGLVDMHVHTESASGWLLNIATGVTAIREMGGFPWMLAARESAAADRLVAPTMYVAGTIINYAPLGGYAVTPRDTFSARRVVRQQRACSFDFIKVHNVVPVRLFDAIADEARRENVDLVGHVPHTITVRHAVEHGMRTMEHLKGFLDDRTLKMGDADYGAAKRPDVWVTPALYAMLRFESPERLQERMRAPEARFVPARTRTAWADVATAPEDSGVRLGREALALMREIVKSLVANDANFLAGTDAANYPFQVMGFALAEELRLLLDAGVPVDEVFTAATTAPAAAMRAEGDFGRILKGMRADIVLLDKNPLDDIGAYRTNAGVMLRGRWLERSALDAALEDLTNIYADDAAPARATKARAKGLADRAEEAVRSGFVFNARILAEASDALRAAGDQASASRLAALAIVPVAGPCAAEIR